MKKYLLFTIFTALPFLGVGQIKTVEFDVVKNQINSGLALPSEEAFYIRGILPEGVELVEMTIFKSNKSKTSGNVYSWRAPYQFKTNQYEIFVADQLRSNESYTLFFSFFKKADREEMDALRDAIHANLEAYIKANYQVGRGKINSLVADRVFLDHLNQIVVQGTENYAHLLGQEFRGFSDLVHQKVDQTRKLRLRNAKFNIINRKKNDNQRALYAHQLITELIDLTKAEVDQYLRSNMLMLVDIRNIEGYPTEKKPFYLPLNVGYAGTYFSGEFDNLDYGTAPFVGLSVPLGNRMFTKFLGNASLSTGVMLTNMQNRQNAEISGPLIGRPIYAGLGYTLFRVLRFNAGAALTSSDMNGNTENITIHPFVGFSLEFNLWLGFNARR
jgi:hypothetical protein